MEKTITSIIKKQKKEDEEPITIIKDHYESKNNPLEKSKHREESRVLNLRKFNNLIKGLLIRKAANLIYRDHGRDYKISAFDFCGGRGGDLAKFMNVGINYLVLADFSEKSTIEARQRCFN